MLKLVDTSTEDIQFMKYKAEAEGLKCIRNLDTREAAVIDLSFWYSLDSFSEEVFTEEIKNQFFAKWQKYLKYSVDNGIMSTCLEKIDQYYIDILLNLYYDTNMISRKG